MGKDEYWDWGWNRRLDFPGKVFYLCGLHYSAVSPDRPSWTRSHEQLIQQHRVSIAFISNGVVALRRACLMSVAYAPLTVPPGPRDANVYTPRALYDPVERDGAIQALAAKYGPDKLARAQNYAALVYDDADVADVAGVELLIQLENQFGPDKIQKAADEIGLKQPTNPRRTMAYLIATIREMRP